MALMTSAICFREQQNLTAGRAVCDQMVAGWQTFKLVAAVRCPNVSFVLFVYLVLFVVLIKHKNQLYS
jgi:hypothetical protein